MATWNSRGLRGSTLEEFINRTNEKYLENGKECIDMCKAMEEWAEELREEGEQLGMKNTLKLVAKMSENGDTEYIARLLEPEVFEQMAEKYGMKA